MLNKLQKLKKIEKFEKMPIIISGDFNVNLLSNKNYNLVQFLKDNWIGTLSLWMIKINQQLNKIHVLI